MRIFNSKGKKWLNLKSQFSMISFKSGRGGGTGRWWNLNSQFYMRREVSIIVGILLGGWEGGLFWGDRIWNPSSPWAVSILGEGKTLRWSNRKFKKSPLTFALWRPTLGQPTLVPFLDLYRIELIHLPAPSDLPRFGVIYFDPPPRFLSVWFRSCLNLISSFGWAYFQHYKQVDIDI